MSLYRRNITSLAVWTHWTWTIGQLVSGQPTAAFSGQDRPLRRARAESPRDRPAVWALIGFVDCQENRPDCLNVIAATPRTGAASAHEARGRGGGGRPSGAGLVREGRGVVACLGRAAPWKHFPLTIRFICLLHLSPIYQPRGRGDACIHIILM